MESTLRRTYRRFIVQMVYFNSRKNVPKKCTKKRDAGARLLFWLLNYCFFDVLVAVAVALVGF